MSLDNDTNPVRFEARDVARFARLSGDHSPLHTDADYARQTPFGEPVAHGSLAVLLALAGVPAREGYRLARLDASFPSPVFPGRAYHREVTEAKSTGEGEGRDLRGNVGAEAPGRRFTVRLLDGERPVLTLEANYEKDTHAVGPNQTPASGGAVWNRTAAASMEPGQLRPGLTAEGSYAPDWTELHDLVGTLRLPDRGVGPEHAAVLAWCSYTLGMELPGDSALMSRIVLSFPSSPGAPSATAPEPTPYGSLELTAFHHGFQALTLRGALRAGRHAQARTFADAELQARARTAPTAPRPHRTAALLPPSERLAGHVAVVIGGSRGLGAALVQALAQQGCTVHLGYHRSHDSAKEVRRGLGEEAARVRLAGGDCSDPKWCRELRDRVVAEHGRCDILVLNACPPLHDMDVTADGGERLLAYVRDSLAMVQTPLAAFTADLAAAGGTVVGISSAAVAGPPAGWSHYVTAKTALEGLVRSLATEYPGIRCLLARPPRLRTTLTHAPLSGEEPVEPETAATAVVTRLIARSEDRPAGAELLDVLPPRGRQRPEAEEENAVDGRLLVSATFTADPAEPALSFWNGHLGLSLRVEFTAYNQIFQQLLDQGSEFAANRRGCNLVLLRLEDWPADNARRTVDDFAAAVDSFTHRSRVPLLILLCPSSPHHADGRGRATELAEDARRLRGALDGTAGAHVIDLDRFGPHYRVVDHHDAAREELGHIPYTPLGYTSLATVAMRAVRALLRPPAKVLVLDCDNTLWAGVCGEDGADGVTLEDGHLRLQRWALGLRDRGVLLCLCSKNHEDDVAAVLRRPDMVLRPEHITSQRVNWDAKSANVTALAAELGVGLDTFVFLDDNPVETAEVAAAHPEVLSLTLPADPTEIPATLDHLWAFDQLEVTAEDSRRAEYYQAGRDRERFRKSTMDYAGFLRGLGLQVHIAEARPDQAPRVSQLTYRTNQFNSTGVRRTEAEVRALPEEGRRCWTVEVSDRFGDYGLVCVAVTEDGGDALVVDGLLMSCRVLGRGVEHTVLARLGEEARAGGYARLDVPFRATERNAPAGRFLESVAGGFAESEDADATDGVVYRIPVASAAAITFHPAEQEERPEEADAAPGAVSPAPTAGLRPESLATIPAALTDLTEVHARAHQAASTATESGGAPPHPAVPDARTGSQAPVMRPVGPGTRPDSSVSAGVREVFHDVLRIPRGRLGEGVALEELGLSSMTIVNLTVGLEARFGSLPRTLLFEHRTVGDVAAAVGRHLGPPNEAPPTTAPPVATPAPVSTPSRGPRPEREPIAVVGIAGRYPGADDLDTFERRLREGTDSVREIPPERWNHSRHYDPSGNDPARSYSKWACLLDDVDRFDSLFFRISPREAELMDPQQRLFLEVSYETLQDAGHTPAGLGTDVGVYVGAMAQDYAVLSAEAALEGRSSLPYAANYQIANRVSYAFDFTGPSLVVDTACSSSGVALHLACQDLRHGRVSAALVGGVNLILHPSRHVQYAHMGMLSRTGRCRTFGAGADGMVMGEGVGAVLLKPLSEALRDGDHVHALIRGTATNSGGHTHGFTVPSPDAQAELVSAALRDAEVDPATVTVVEAHGTGTPLGDPIEIRGLAKAFGPRVHDRPACAVGSVKTAIGHLEPAAAIAGLTKVVLQLRHRTLLPSPGASTPNPDIDFEATPFFVPDRLMPWDEAESPRRAGISSFGAGGVNAHVVLEEYQPEAHETTESRFTMDSEAAELIVLSARTRDRLAVHARRLHDFLAGRKPRPALRDTAHTLRVGREPLEVRVAFVVNGMTELIDSLARLAEEGVEGAEALDSAHTGRVEGGRAALTEVFDGGTEATAFLAALAARGELSKLAKLWTQGVPIDWREVLPTPAARRVPLPAYPFALARHWLPAGDGPAPATAPRPTTAPGLPGELEWDPERGRAELGWDGSEPYLRDHVIAGHPTVPGVLYLEMARAAAERIATTPGFTTARVRGMVWSRPLVVTDGAVRAQLCARSTAGAAPERIEVTFHEPDGEGPETARCTVTAEAADGGQPCDLDGWRAGLQQPERLGADAVYAAMTSRGMTYGPGLRAVRSLERSAMEAVSTLTVPPDPDWAEHRFALHPALLDGALQSALVGSGLPGTYLPYSLAELAVHRLPTGTCHARVRFRQRNASMIRCDITVADDDSRAVLSLTDLVLLPRTGPEGRAQAEAHAYRPVWEPVPEPSAGAGTRPPRVLVLADDPALEAEWHHAVASGRVTAEVLSGTEGDGAGPAADASLVVDYRPHERRGTGDQPWLATVHGLGTAAVAEGRPVTYLCVTGPDETDPLGVAVSAFGLSVSRETARFRCTRVEVADGAAAPGPERLLAEYAAGEAEVRYSGADAERAVRRFRPAPAVEGETAFRENGTYLITGGAGGIGRSFATHLTAAHKATVVLLGRTAPEELTPPLPEAAHYVQADVTDAKAVRQALDSVRERHGPLHGVIHAAGVVADALLRDKPLTSCAAVLAPKVAGTLALDEATAEEDLDFFVLMSSTAGALGNAGQTDYAMANRFLDAFAEQRTARVAAGARSGRTVSLSWPLWRDGGMRVDGQTARLTAATTGFQPMPAAAGILALEKALLGRDPVLLLAHGDLSRIERTLERQPAPWPDEAGPSTGPEAPAAAETITADLGSALTELLCELAADLLKVSRNDMDDDVEFADVGFDSVLFAQYANRINDRLDLELAPVVFFDNSTIGSLVRTLLRHHGEGIAAALAPSEPLAPSGPPPEATPGHSWTPTPTPTPHVAPPSPPAPELPGHPEPIAVVGIAGRFPGAPDLDTYWDNLLAGRDQVREIPPDRWDWRAHHDASSRLPGATQCRWGGFLDDIYGFDAAFFRIAPREAQLMDPQQRLFLEACWAALENAGYDPRRLSGSPTGVFAGVSLHDYLQVLEGAGSEVVGHTATGNVHSIVPNRVSYLLDLRGPSEAVDTACSSSLVALHRAVGALRTGECDAAIAGGVNVLLSPKWFTSFDRAGMLSSHGRCATFDHAADGYVRGEGVGAVVLKRLGDARRDGDTVHAVIRGTAVGHGGHGHSLTAPVPTAQADLIESAYRQAGISPWTVSFVETHGTGTELGDPIEVEGLVTAFSRFANDKGAPYGSAAGRCGLGAVKSAIGHLESASGIAGFLKTVLAMRHRTLPANLHFQKLNPHIQLAETPFYVVDSARPWEPGASPDGAPLPRRAGLSSFGFGGVNAHVVLEEPPPATTVAPPDDTPRLVVASATGPEHLREYARRLLHALTAAPEGPPPLADVAHTLQTGRPELPYRLAVVARTVDELVAALAAFADGRRAEGLFTGHAEGRKAPELSPTLPTAALAEGWVLGGRAHWESLRGSGPVRRVPLPGHPFDRQPHGVPSPFTAGDAAAKGTVSDIDAPGYAAPPADRNGQSGPSRRQRGLLLAPGWRPALPPATPVRPAAAGHRPVLLLLLNREQTLAVTSVLGQASEATWVVMRERSALPRLAHHEYEFDSGAGDAGARLLAEDLLRAHPRLDGVVDLTDIRSDDRVDDAAAVRIELFRAVLASRKDADRVSLLHLARHGATRPEAARMAGLVRALGAEYSAATAITADVACEPRDGAEQLAVVRAELGAMEAGEPPGEVRHRDGGRHLRALSEVSTSASVTPLAGHLGPFPLDPQRVYLITGGTGGLGLAAAERLVARGARRIALLGRRPLPPRLEWDAALADEHPRAETIAAIRRLEAAGADVLTHHGTLTDTEELAAFLDDVRSRLGTVAGVLHCAGVVPHGPQPFVRQEPAAIRDIWEPKGEGLLTLDRLLADHRPDFVVLYSSVSAAVPALGAGLAAYAGANAFLDSYAERAAGLGGVSVYRSVAWGSWRGVGVGEADSAAYRASRLAALDPEQALDLLEQALATDEPWLLAVAATEGFEADQLLVPKRFEPAVAPATPDAPTAAGPPFSPPQDEQGEDEQGVATAREFLLSLFTRELLVSREAMASGATFGELGVDSIFIAGLVGHLEEYAGRPVPPAVVLEHDTVDALAQYLARSAPVASRQPTKTPMPEPVSAATPGSPFPLAVIGMAGRYPGATDLDAYWRLLRDGDCTVGEVPADRWDTDALYRCDSEPGRTISRWGGFLDGIAEFDPDHFGIREADAAHMDPLARLFLECGEAVFRDAGLPRAELAGRRIGVFVGSGTGGYGERVVTPEPHTATGLNQNFIAAQLAQVFDLRGPNLVVDTACSSSLTALHLATQSMRLGESEMCLVGGADLLLDETPFLKLSASGALSPRGQCRAFDADADGIVLGEGVGAVLLKPLQASLADGDRIHAVIEGSAVNNDGRTMGLTTPSLEAQQQLVAEALAAAGVGADAVSYVEAHGTGTMIGDPIELRALTTVFRRFTRESGYCAVGSVKSNIGHLLLASGIAGLHKVVLSLTHRQIPPTLHCDEPNPRFDFADSPFFPNTALREWAPRDGVRRAGLSAFGFGGTNAHVILRELTASEHALWAPRRSPLPPANLRRRRFWLERRRPGGVPSDVPAAPPPRENGHAVHRTPLLALQEGDL